MVPVPEPKKRLVKVPKALKILWEEVALSVLRRVLDAVVAKKAVVVAPDLVSIEKIDEEAALSTSKARPLIGVWRVVVAP